MTDEQKILGETVRNELGYRREKQWKSFSWTATLLLAGGARPTSMTDEQKTLVETVRNELGYRREKQWKIFSWTATLLLAAIAGVITLVGKKEFLFPIWPQRAVMVAALVLISFYACSWIHENIKFESRSRSRLLELLSEAGLTEHLVPDPERAPMFGYIATIIFLAIGAVGTILFASSQGWSFVGMLWPNPGMV